MSDEDVMNKNVEKLNKILLSEKVVENFYESYRNDGEFNLWLNEIIPEVSACDKMEQNNPWHIYNVLEHILHSVEEINKITKSESDTDKRILSYTMFLHDIGKPEKHIKRLKNGVMIDSFFNHNIASEKIAGRVLPQLGFKDNEVEIIKKLVNKHDIFMFIRLEETSNPHWRRLTDGLIEEEIKELNAVGDGKKLLGHLVKVGRADNLAQNPEMTAYSLKMLDKFDEMLCSRVK